jgi:ribonuclease VapC
LIAVDTSALIAILFDEPEAARFVALIEAAGTALVGTPTALETRMVALGQSTPEVAQEAATMLSMPPFEFVPFTIAHLEVASAVFECHGKGRARARLNYGDCMSYAVAAVAGCPLLFKGDDFSHTDIESAG